MQTQSEASTAFSLDDITKTFGGTRALKGVTITLAPGTVHALVGENGAGKSTALSVLAGKITPTSGRIITPIGAVESLTPRRARSMGIHAVYQELTVVPALTPAANVFLGAEERRAGVLRDRAMRRAYVELCERVGVKVATARRAGDLSVAEQQTLEILRAVRSNAKVILFDEPTAALAESERLAFFRVVKQLRDSGVALAFVSHNLEEVLENSDDITVFRDGLVVDERPSREWTKALLVQAMLGSSQSAGMDRRPEKSAAMISRKPLLEVRQLRTRKNDQPIDFTLYAGEILGIAGLVGSGRTSLLRALAGLDPEARGELVIQGKVRSLPWSVRKARRSGLSLLPEDRKTQGLALRLSASSNVSMGEAGKASTLGFIQAGTMREMCSSAVSGLGFDTSRLPAPAWTFSGGNQQKLLLGRWILSHHLLLLADEPSRGVDVGVRAQIEEALRAFTDRGCGVILVSSELEEVAALSDRIIVLHQGRAVATLRSGYDDTSVDHLLRLAFGSNQATGEEA